MSRRAVLIFVHVFLALQLFGPLSYYTFRQDPYDERFAWRMFSRRHMQECQPQYVVDGRPMNLYARFHDAWIKIAQRGRRQVIESMAERLCEDFPDKEVKVHLGCRNLADKSTETIGSRLWNVCPSGRLK